MWSALLLALAVQAAPAPSSSELTEIYTLFVEGQLLAGAGDLPGAIAKYRQALAVVPSAAEIRAELAGAHAERGELADAEAEAERALVADPANRTAHRLLGLIAASRLARTARAEVPGLVAAATRHLEQSNGLAIRDPVVMLTLGELYLRAVNFPRAIAVLEQFLVDRPGYPQAVILLAEAYRESGKPEAAQALIDGFGGSPSDSPDAARAEAIALGGRGAWVEAAAAWARVVEADPDDVSAKLQFASALANAGDLANARVQLNALTRQVPDEVAVWHLLAGVELRAGRLQMAEDAARRIEAIDPADSRGPLMRAAVGAERDDYQSVVAILDRRVRAPLPADVTSGAFAEMASRLAGAWLELDNTKRAIDVLEGARARVPDDLDLAFSLAAAYERARSFGAAERTFRAIIGADPEHDGALNYLGYMLADRGQKLPEAVSLIERALALDPDNASYLDSLGWAYFKQKRYAAAIDPLERAARGAPTSSVILDHLGDAYLQAKRFTEAASTYDRALAGDRDGIDAEKIAKKRDRARSSAAPR